MSNASIKKTKAGLTANQRRFFLMLGRTTMEKVKNIWDPEIAYCRPTTLRVVLNNCSDGERIMCQFFTMLWSGENEFDFDICKAIRTLDQHNLMIIQNWVKTPFWP